MALMVIRRCFQSKHGVGGVVEYGLNATIDSVARLLMGLSNDEGVWLFLTITLSETVRQRKPGVTDQSINLHISNRLYEAFEADLRYRYNAYMLVNLTSAAWHDKKLESPSAANCEAAALDFAGAHDALLDLAQDPCFGEQVLSIFFSFPLLREDLALGASGGEREEVLYRAIGSLESTS
ncbi:hypothetical protein MMC22_007497 [Lobaria immixta]|nr:hypothetical protein [Lobaria immixta]